MLCSICNLPAEKLGIIPCRCGKPCHQMCLTSIRIRSQSAFVQCETCKTTYIAKEMSRWKVLQPLIWSMFRAIATCTLSVFLIHWILFNITMSFHHWVIVREENNMLSYSSYVDIFVLERDTILLASYLNSPVYVSFTQTYISVIVGISVVVGFTHLVRGQPLPPLHGTISRMCCDCARGADPRAFLVVLCFSFALAGFFAFGLGMMDIYQYFWKNPYQRWIREKDALFFPVLDLLEGEAPYRRYFEEANYWSEKGIDNIILCYVY
jgi:protein-S-isoprenylcysteine O-methyltransferase Ste14